MKHIPPEITELDLSSDECEGQTTIRKQCSTLNQGDDSKRETFALSNYKQFLYENGLHSDIFKLLEEHKDDSPRPNNGAYKDHVSINEKKVGDIKKVMHHIQDISHHGKRQM
nr:unnamed protein product [Callosobruchus analis]